LVLENELSLVIDFLKVPFLIEVSRT
jgi:hypothetical protein